MKLCLRYGNVELSREGAALQKMSLFCGYGYCGARPSANVAAAGTRISETMEGDVCVRMFIVNKVTSMLADASDLRQRFGLDQSHSKNQNRLLRVSLVR